jgi:hypothetical protein
LAGYYVSFLNEGWNMGRVLLYEVRKAFGGRWFWITLFLCCALAALNAADSVYKFYAVYDYLYSGDVYSFPTSTSCFSAWIGCGGWSQTTYSLFFYGIVFLAPMAYAWSSISEVESTYANNVAIRMRKSAYMTSKLVAVFLSSGTVVAAAFLFNLALIACAFPAYAPCIYDVLYVGVSEGILFSNLFYSAPALFVAARTLVAFVLCGAWGAFVCALGFAIKNRVLVFIVPYLALLGLESINSNIYILFGENLNGTEIAIFDLLQAIPVQYSQSILVICAVAAILLAASFLIAKVKSRADLL